MGKVAACCKNLKAWVVAFCSLHVIATCGLSIGWNALLLIYQAESKYSFLCASNELVAGTSTVFDKDRSFCEEEQAYLSYIFSVAYGIQWTLALPIGLFVDYFGPRVSILGQIMIIASLFGMISFVPHPDMAIDWNLVCLCFLFTSRYFIITRYMHYAHLFKNNYNLVTTILTTSATVGGGLFLLFYGICILVGTNFNSILGYFIGIQLIFALFCIIQPSKSVKPHEALAFSWKKFRLYSYDVDSTPNRSDTVVLEKWSDECKEEVDRDIDYVLLDVKSSHTAEGSFVGNTSDHSFSNLWKHVQATTTGGKSSYGSDKGNEASTTSGSSIATDISGLVLKSENDLEAKLSDAYYESKICHIEVLEEVDKLSSKWMSFSYDTNPLYDAEAVLKEPLYRRIWVEIRTLLSRENWKSIFRFRTVVTFIHFWVHYCVFTFFLNTIHYQLTLKAGGSSTIANQYTFYFSCIVPFGFAGSIWVAIIGDRVGIAYMFFVQVTLTTLHVVGTYLPIGSVQFLTFLGYCIGEDILYAIIISVIGKWFPSQWFCSIYGFVYSFSGALSFMVGALALRVLDGQINLMMINSIWLILVLLTFFVPVYLIDKAGSIV